MRLLLMIAGFAMLIALSYAEYNISYALGIHYNNGNLSLSDIELVEGNGPDRLNQPESGYTLSVISFGGEKIHSFRFEINPVVLEAMRPEWFDENGTQIYFPKASPQATETDEMIIVPYYHDAKEIRIEDEKGRPALLVDVSPYAKPELMPDFADKRYRTQAILCGGVVLLAVLAAAAVGGVAGFGWLRGKIGKPNGKKGKTGKK